MATTVADLVKAGMWRGLADLVNSLVTGKKLSELSATTSAELKTVISDETGSGALVFANTPTLVTPVLGAATGTSVIVTGAVQGATVTATGAVAGDSVAATGAVTGASVTATAGVQGATVTATGDLVIKSATVAATGADQAGAAQLAGGFTLVSAADGTKGVKLPAAAAGKVVIVKNNVNAVLKVYPSTDDAINALAANASFDIAALTSAVLVAYDGVTWYSVPLLPS